MEANNSTEWSETDSASFTDHGAEFTPERADQYRMILRLLESSAGKGQVVDLCCGAGELCEAMLMHFPEGEILGLDGSEGMLAASRERLERFGKRVRVERFDLRERDWRKFGQPVSAFVSTLAVHHLEGEEKQALFRDLHDLLVPGGVFVMADLVRPSREVGEAIAAEAWEDWVEGNASERGKALFFAEGWNYFRAPDADPVDKPSRLTDLLRWMEEAGFVDVDVFWMKAGQVVMAGWKEA